MHIDLHGLSNGIAEHIPLHSIQVSSLFAQNFTIRAGGNQELMRDVSILTSVQWQPGQAHWQSLTSGVDSEESKLMGYSGVV